jgi:hypothetical protein
MMGGLPASRFEPGDSQGSAPARTNKNVDIYRNAANAGIPPNSTFAKDDHDYHKLDQMAEKTYKEYMKYLGTSRKTTVTQRNQNPGVFDGQPLETVAWHERATELAAIARDTCRE